MANDLIRWEKLIVVLMIQFTKTKQRHEDIYDRKQRLFFIVLGFGSKSGG